MSVNADRVRASSAGVGAPNVAGVAGRGRRPIDRRTFLGGALAAAGGVALGASPVPDLSFATRNRRVALAPERMFELPAAEAPIDTIVVVMLENRSFDHLIGWLGSDDDYLEQGRRRYGRGFGITASIDEQYADPEGRVLQTQEAFAGLEGEAGALRGCTYNIPGHSWKQGRVQRDHGFLASGTGNDEYAISYFADDALPYHRAITSSFTVLDHYFSSLLGPTFPNRQYLHSAQSEGYKNDPGPLKSGIYRAETIWDRLMAAGVPATYYYTDVPLLRLWGPHLKPLVAPLTQYFEQALSGTLPNVVMVEPSFKGGARADGHPRGDLRIAAAFTSIVVEALLHSPQWSRSMLVIAHDEWGGFYDHVAPPRLPDARASKNDANDFAQAGFRVAAALVSPFAAGNAVDHTVYDHTSILRLLEWRFLGAPARGTHRGSGSPWWLTTRDRHAHPIGQTLVSTPVNTDVEALISAPIDVTVSKAVAECAEADAPEGEAPFLTHPTFDEEMAGAHPPVTSLPWQT
jgi:phospholipase C